MDGLKTSIRPADTARRNGSNAVPADAAWYRSGLAVLLTGVALWATSIAVTTVTKDAILLPIVILVGSFVVPLSVVVFVFRRHVAQGGEALSPTVMVQGFLGGGTVGVLLSALIETYLVPSRTGTFLVVGLVEEACKGLVILLVARRLRTRAPLAGMVLGAVVGAGFAAFESAGYAFEAYISPGAPHPFLNLLQTEFNRALASPFGHILWTSVLGGALFAATAGGRRFRVTWGVSGAYGGVVALHTLWDQSHGWAIILTRGFTGAGWHVGWPDAAAWAVAPTHLQHDLFKVLYNGPLLVIALAGSLWFIEMWRRYGCVERLEPARTTSEWHDPDPSRR